MCIPGIFIPGMLPIWCFCAGFFFRDERLAFFIPDIFIPGMFIPGMLPIWCFCAGFFFRDERLAFFIPDIFIPGMLPILCFCAGFFVGVLFFLDFALCMPGML